MSFTKLIPVFVQEMPEIKEQGILYISYKYETAIHLCACGCGELTVTPFSQGWKIINTPIQVDGQDQNIITVRPSIGNQKLPCKSHYFITNNQIDWR